MGDPNLSEIDLVVCRERDGFRLREVENRRLSFLADGGSGGKIPFLVLRVGFGE